MAAWIRRLGLGGGVCVTASVFFDHVGFVCCCDGDSMKPAMGDGDWVLVHRFMEKIKRNDVVFLRSPQDPREFLIKRVTKLEGEDISRDIAGAKPWVPRGHVWLEGDNKAESLDSRVYGPVSQGLISGKVLLTLFPLAKAGFVTPPRPTLVETLRAEAQTDKWQDPWNDDRDENDDDDDDVKENYNHSNNSYKDGSFGDDIDDGSFNDDDDADDDDDDDS